MVQKVPKIPFFPWIVEDNNQVHTLYLVQVKSSADKGVILDTTKAHQEYMAILPQLIDPLNKKASFSNSKFFTTTCRSNCPKTSII